MSLYLTTDCFYTLFPQQQLGKKYWILEIVGIPTICRYTDSGGSPDLNTSPVLSMKKNWIISWVLLVVSFKRGNVATTIEFLSTINCISLRHKTVFLLEKMYFLVQVNLPSDDLSATPDLDIMVKSARGAKKNLAVLQVNMVECMAVFWVQFQCVLRTFSTSHFELWQSLCLCHDSKLFLFRKIGAEQADGWQGPDVAEHPGRPHH
jgi:hypothetical protein